MSDETKAKREQLKALSKKAAEIVKNGDAATINEALVLIYKASGHSEINSFKSWLDKGFAVKKGEKALLLWGKPKATQKPIEEATEDDVYNFWPLAYVFSNQQVNPKK